METDLSKCLVIVARGAGYSITSEKIEEELHLIHEDRSEATRVAIDLLRASLQEAV